MHPDCSPVRPMRPGHEFSTALLVATTPQDVIALAATLPVGIACAFSSPRWPEAIASEPAADDAQLARAVREVAACRAGGGADPRSLLLCDEPGGAVALLRLESPLPAGARARRDCELAGRRLAELLALRRLRADVSHLEKAEQLQRALYAIADMAGSELDMPDMLRGLHSIIRAEYAETSTSPVRRATTAALRLLADTGPRRPARRRSGGDVRLQRF